MKIDQILFGQLFSSYHIIRTNRLPCYRLRWSRVHTRYFWVVNSGVMIRVLIMLALMHPFTSLLRYVLHWMDLHIKQSSITRVGCNKICKTCVETRSLIYSLPSTPLSPNPSTSSSSLSHIPQLQPYQYHTHLTSISTSLFHLKAKIWGQSSRKCHNKRSNVPYLSCAITLFTLFFLAILFAFAFVFSGFIFAKQSCSDGIMKRSGEPKHTTWTWTM